MKWLKENWMVITLVVILNIITCLLTLGLCQKRYESKYEDYEYFYNLNYFKEAELKYWETKSKLVTEVQKYIESVAPTSNLRAYQLVDKCEECSIDLSFVLAQGEIESFFGTKGLASKTNSVWNVGAFDGLKSNEISKQHKFRHPNESIEPYFKLLRSKYLINKTEYDLLNKYVDVNNHRYASDTHYEERLKAKFEQIKLSTKIDSLQSELKYYAIKCNR